MIKRSGSLTPALPSRMTFLMLLLMVCLKVSAQNPAGYCTVLQQACNNDGILVTLITSGMTPPLDFNYSNGTVHTNISTMSDTLSGASFFTHVYITDANQHHLILNTGFIQPFIIDYPLVNPAICPDTIGSVFITINSGSAPDSVHWYESIFPGLGAYVGEGNPVNLPLGQYAYVVTDSNGCQLSPDSNLINILSYSGIQFTITQQNANCTDGFAEVTNIAGGAPPYTYLWSNGSTSASISNLLQGYYEVTVTDTLGCTTTMGTDILQGISIQVNTSAASDSCLLNLGSAVAFGSGGVPPYSYAWSNGASGQSISGLSGGTNLIVWATDANGCSGWGQVHIGTLSPVQVTYNSIPSNCLTPTGSASLNISGGTSPYSVSWNTYPPVSGPVITNMPPGQYPYLVTDATGCKRSGTVLIDPQTSLYCNISGTDPVCPAMNGSALVSAFGSNPPLSYQWSNGSTQNSISNLGPGTYCCTITDQTGCQNIKCVTLSQSSPITLGFSTNPASCLFSADGSIHALATGGTPPYTYTWANGQSGSTLINLTHGYYTLTVHDADGCVKTNSCYVSYNPNNDSCYCVIQGIVYHDLNSNCVQDTAEAGIRHIMLHCSGAGYTFTDSTGVYSFLVPSGTYTLSEIVQNTYPLSPCQTNPLTFTVSAGPSCIIQHEFANAFNPLHDIEVISSGLGHAVPGYDFSMGMIISNQGTITEANILASLRHDGQLFFSGTAPAVFTPVNPLSDPHWYHSSSGILPLAPGQSQMITLNYHVPSNIPLGTAVQFLDTTSYAAPISNWLSDYTPWNNIFTGEILTVGSFDPNFKEVIPVGSGEEGYLTAHDTVLNYVIHFQNTGTYFARNITITDTISSHLDVSTLHPGFSTHNYIASVSEDGVLKFDFNDINLPYQSLSETESMGLISYSVKLKPGLLPGTQILNTAGIYFDFNEVIITNTTLNTIQEASYGNTAATADPVIFYPNPFASFLYADLSGFDHTAEITIYDLPGRILFHKVLSGGDVHQLELNEYENGVYFVILRSKEGKSYCGKLIRNF